jgi:mannan endo-1,4-beta-mannosidase
MKWKRSGRAAVAAGLGLALGIAGYAAQGDAAQTRAAAVRAVLPDRSMSYLGVFEKGSPASMKPVAGFAKMAGREPNLIQYYLGWRAFDASYAKAAWARGSSLLVDLDPTGVSLSSIADGHQNSYLDALAAVIRGFGHPVAISFGHEMNGDWYPWGWGHKDAPPKTFVAAWKHIVELFSKAGAGNVTWLWTINALGPHEGPIRDWWPGAKYVSWVGINGYLYTKSSSFQSEFGQSIAAVRRLTRQPIFISETAVGAFSGQAAKITALFAGASHDHLLGLLWFDADQSGGRFKLDWRLEGHRSAETAFRAAVKRYIKKA